MPCVISRHQSGGEEEVELGAKIVPVIVRIKKANFAISVLAEGKILGRFFDRANAARQGTGQTAESHQSHFAGEEVGYDNVDRFLIYSFGVADAKCGKEKGRGEALGVFTISGDVAH
jgi:hypothetical protein